MELSLQTRTVADHVVLEVGGEIDLYTAPRLKERLRELIDDGTRQIVVDLEDVDFLDSTGLGVLAGALKRIREQGGHLALVCTHDRVLKSFRLTGLLPLFDFHSSVEAAVEAEVPEASSPRADEAKGGSPPGSSPTSES